MIWILTRAMAFRRLYIFIALLSVFSVCAQDQSFSPEALNDVLIDSEGSEIKFKSVIEKNKGKVVLLDIWASWCKDCVVGMPIVKQLKEEFPNVVFVYISLDKNEASWKNGIERFEIQEGSHFWAADGWKSELFKSIDLDWIPRYMILDELGNIKLYKAIKASDKEIVKQLKG